MFHKAKLADGERSLPRHQIFAVGIILSMLAGYLEAYTYILRGGVFCNGQTSNIALMMINFVRGDFSRALYYPIPIAAFFFGIVFAAFLRSHMHNLKWARVEMLFLLLEMALLFIVGFVPQGGGDTPVNIVVTFICAVQYEIFRETRGLPYLIVIGAFALGVFGGAQLARVWDVKSIWVCCVMLVALMPLMVRVKPN